MVVLILIYNQQDHPVNCDALDEKLKCFNQRYEDFIDKYGKFNRTNDKKETIIETLENEILSVKADIVSLDKELKHMQTNADEEIAKKLQESPQIGSQ